ncbi:MAG: nitroreductase family protein [Armatimonadetes bacterium]|nr:nitroreductase family protein [Armatimonadota bacterium]
MGVSQAIQTRRAYRALEGVEITEETIKDLAYHASLAPSCFNNQPWRFVFVRSPGKLREVFAALPKGNAWATKASLVVAVYSGKELDCALDEREYYLFDTGLAAGFMVLRATELGLVAHPIAGYDPAKVKQALDIPEEMCLITLIVVGKHAPGANELLTDFQKAQEASRPERKPFDEIARIV